MCDSYFFHLFDREYARGRKLPGICCPDLRRGLGTWWGVLPVEIVSTHTSGTMAAAGCSSASCRNFLPADTSVIKKTYEVKKPEEYMLLLSAHTFNKPPQSTFCRYRIRRK